MPTPNKLSIKAKTLIDNYYTSVQSLYRINGEDQQTYNKCLGLIETTSIDLQKYVLELEAKANKFNQFINSCKEDALC